MRPPTRQVDVTNCCSKDIGHCAGLSFDISNRNEKQNGTPTPIFSKLRSHTIILSLAWSHVFASGKAKQPLPHPLCQISSHKRSGWDPIKGNNNKQGKELPRSWRSKRLHLKCCDTKKERIESKSLVSPINLA